MFRIHFSFYILIGCLFLPNVASAQQQDWDKAIGPFLQDHCVTCHNTEVKKSGLDLSSLTRDLSGEEGLSKWVRIHDRVANGEMPPNKRSAPPKEEKLPFLKTLSQALTVAHQKSKATVLHRLNREEYENTLKDLLGIHTELKGMLPEDGSAHGFDTVGSALDISPIHMKMYLQAADKALGDASVKRPAPKKISETYSFADNRHGKNFIGKMWLQLPDKAVVSFSSGSYPPLLMEQFRARKEGHYKVRVTGYAHQSENPIAFAVYFGPPFNGTSRRAGFYEVPPKKPTTIEIQDYLREGESVRISPYGLGGSNYGQLRKIGPKKYKGPGLAIQHIQVEGPIVKDWPGKGYRTLFGKLPSREIEPSNPSIKKKRWYKPKYEIVTKEPMTDAQRLLRQFMPLAFRRPVDDATIRPYLNLVKSRMEKGDTFEGALRTGYTAVLCSPGFLLRQENPGKLDDFALASRLSYFLWSSMPDDELLELAAKKQLSDAKILRQQTERMLKDNRAKRFTKNFVGQWLDLRNIDFTVPDRQLYPEFDEMLEEASVRETESFFEEVLHNNLSVVHFLDSDWTMANERLAKHYDIDGVKGVEFRKVKLPANSHRGGVLTHASVLRVTANGANTSPVVRGAWVLDRILGTPPPPPPPGIPGVEPDIRGAKTLREQLAKHRDLKSCASCHQHIDPPGFALESYDVIGGWRDNYRSKGKQFPFPKIREVIGRRINYRIGPKVDASGEMSDGEKFNGPDEFKQLLLAKKDQFTRALIVKLATYATGRGMGFSDRPLVDELVRNVRAKDYRFRELIHEVVQSPIFREK